MSAFGPQGPWAGRRGYDSLVQTCSGMNVSEAEHFGGDAVLGYHAEAVGKRQGVLVVKMRFSIISSLLLSDICKRV